MKKKILAMALALVTLAAVPALAAERGDGDRGYDRGYGCYRDGDGGYGCYRDGNGGYGCGGYHR